MSGFNGAVEGGVLHGYDVVNNLTSTATNQPLSAAMGKTLEEHIQQSTAKDNLDLSSKTAITTDVFTLTSGVYRCGSSAPNLPVQGAGYITVIYRANDIRCLEYMTDSGRFFTNTMYNGTWTGWKEYEDKQSTAPVEFTLTSTDSNKFVVVDSDCYKIGNVAVVNLSFNVLTSPTSTEHMLTGFPPPKKDVTVLCGKSGSVAVITGNKLRNNWDTFNANTRYYLNMAYATA